MWGVTVSIIFESFLFFLESVYLIHYTYDNMCSCMILTRVLHFLDEI